MLSPAPVVVLSPAPVVVLSPAPGKHSGSRGSVLRPQMHWKARHQIQRVIVVSLRASGVYETGLLSPLLSNDQIEK